MPNFLPRQKYPFEQRYQFLDSVTFYSGAHTIKGGFDVNFIKEELQNLFQGGGVYSYSGLSTIALDCPVGARASGCTPSGGRNYTTYAQAFDQNGLGGALAFNSATYAAYVQDMWRLNDRLLVNLGLRYDYQQLPQPGSVETDGVTFVGNPAVPQTTRVQQGQEELGPADRRDLRPGRQARHGGSRVVRHLLRPDQQQRGRQRLAEQRDQSRRPTRSRQRRPVRPSTRPR